MPWNNGLTQLQYELADLYFQEDTIRRVVVQAGIPAAVLDIDGAALTAWHKCEAGIPLLHELTLKDAAFEPSRGVLAWLIGFIQIPYLRDGDSTILSKVEDILVTRVKLCSQP